LPDGKERRVTAVYFDNHATTPLDRRVLEEMLPFLESKFGNAASKTHAFGWEAEKACDGARARIAALIGATPQEIVFTSGATESDNLALKGIANGYGQKGRHIVTCVTEHRAVLDSASRLERQGFEVSYLGVDGRGGIDLDELRAAIREDTILISLMAANNEIGTVHPLRAIGEVAKERRTLFHCDAAQAAGKLPLDVEAMHIDLMSLSAHKMYGPKGVGALYVRRRPHVNLTPLIDGGGHERGIRSGTLNVPGCVGFGKAAELAATEMVAEAEQISGLRDLLRDLISTQLEGVSLNGHPTERLPGNLNLSFEGIDSDSLMVRMPNVAVSSGSACSSAAPEPSYVLRAVGLPEDLAFGSIRFGLGRFNTEDEVRFVADRVVESVVTLREINATGSLARSPDG
jgi:cysteine desulfurase